MNTLREAVRDAVRTLSEAGVHSPEFDALALAAHVLNTTPSEVRKQMILGAETPIGFQPLIDERARRVPLQHLTGQAPFRRLLLQVGPGVFTPRFETELTAALAITHLQSRGSRQFVRGEPTDLGSLPAQPQQSRQFARPLPTDLGSLSGQIPRSRQSVPAVPAGFDNLPDKPTDKLPRSTPGPRTNCLDPRVVVDLCCGSGAIGLAVRDEVGWAEVYGVEISELAYAWAIRNRDLLGLDVDIRLGDAMVAFAELEGEVDVVVCNPPYIPVGAVPHDPEVRDHDPAVALYGGSADGLRIPLEVAGRAAVLLRAGGLLVMEHADVQGDSLPAALASSGLWQDIQDHEDLNGRPRAVTAFRAG